MSDFFEMRAIIDKKMAMEKKDRLIHSRVYQAMMVALLATVIGMGHGIYKLQEPVGSVTKDFCTKKPCTTFTFEPTRN